MPWSRFLGGFVVVVLLSYVQPKAIAQWGTVEISFFMMFFIIRSPNQIRALIQIFLLSLGVDLVLQAAHVKGISAMSELLLAFAVIELKRSVVPEYEDLFLLGFFAIFYLANYYISLGISAGFGVYYPVLSLPRLLFLALFHTTVMAVLLMLSIRFSPKEKT
ncbi:MAG: hypothetical protein QNK37_18490 [Acidobacteriota bacterium]|nr:hypothetical protein [Acidobacteriota bacterium]